MTAAGSARHPAASWALRLLLAGAAVLSATSAGWANAPADWPEPAFGAQQSAPEARPAPAGSVTFGRALDLEGTPLRLTVARRGAVGSYPRGTTTMARGRFSPQVLPLRGAGISSSFGWRRHPISGGSKFHAGIDLAAPSGTPIVATAAGVVASADWYGGYGLCVTVDHLNGYVTLYGHMSQITVSAGQQVLAGQPLGRVGSTGSSTGPHLHYELRRDGYAVNPGF